MFASSEPQKEYPLQKELLTKGKPHGHSLTLLPVPIGNLHTTCAYQFSETRYVHLSLF